MGGSKLDLSTVLSCFLRQETVPILHCLSLPSGVRGVGNPSEMLGNPAMHQVMEVRKRWNVLRSLAGFLAVFSLFCFFTKAASISSGLSLGSCSSPTQANSVTTQLRFLLAILTRRGDKIRSQIFHRHSFFVAVSVFYLIKRQWF